MAGGGYRCHAGFGDGGSFFGWQVLALIEGA